MEDSGECNIWPRTRTVESSKGFVAFLMILVLLYSIHRDKSDPSRGTSVFLNAYANPSLPNTASSLLSKHLAAHRQPQPDKRSIFQTTWKRIIYPRRVHHRPPLPYPLLEKVSVPRRCRWQEEEEQIVIGLYQLLVAKRTKGGDRQHSTTSTSIDSYMPTYPSHWMKAKTFVDDDSLLMKSGSSIYQSENGVGDGRREVGPDNDLPQKQKVRQCNVFPFQASLQRSIRIVANPHRNGHIGPTK